MEAFLVSTGIVGLAEIGDKTQLLSLLLAVRYRKPWPIILGIFVATLVNHGLAGAAGAWITTAIDKNVLRWIVGLSFLGMAAWMLIPDKLDEQQPTKERFGIFGSTLIAFFMAEMGDKTQIATVALAARYDAFLPVVMGTTLGILLVNVPVVLLGGRLGQRVPVRLVHAAAAVVFAVLGAVVLLNAGRAA